MLKYVLSMLMVLIMTPVQAESVINSPVKIVVPFGPGGTTSIVARIIAAKLSEEIKQPVTVENKPGAGGVLGTVQVSNSPADGLTLGMSTITTHASNYVFFKELPYHPLKDFIYVTTIAATPKVLVNRTDFSNTNSLREVTKIIQSNPDKFTYGAIFPGGIDYLYGEVFKITSKTKMTFVPYKDSTSAVTDLLGGHIHFVFDNLPAVLPNVQAGRINILAISWPERLKEFPNVPTWKELGYDELNIDAWYGLTLPKDTPNHIVIYYNTVMKKVLSNPEIQEKLRANFAYVVADTPDQAKQRAETTLSKLEKIAKSANLVKKEQEK